MVFAVVRYSLAVALLVIVAMVFAVVRYSLAVVLLVIVAMVFAIMRKLRCLDAAFVHEKILERGRGQEPRDRRQCELEVRCVGERW